MTNEDRRTFTQPATRQVIQAQQHLNIAQADLDAARGLLERLAREPAAGDAPQDVVEGATDA